MDSNFLCWIFDHLSQKSCDEVIANENLMTSSGQGLATVHQTRLQCSTPSSHFRCDIWLLYIKWTIHSETCLHSIRSRRQINQKDSICVNLVSLTSDPDEIQQFLFSLLTLVESVGVWAALPALSLLLSPRQPYSRVRITIKDFYRTLPAKLWHGANLYAYEHCLLHQESWFRISAMRHYKAMHYRGRRSIGFLKIKTVFISRRIPVITQSWYLARPVRPAVA